MSVYRFRVTFEDHEETYREIEIKSTQNFEDFHFSILQSIDFDSKHNASFFISDDYWRKGNEIILRQENEEVKNVKNKKKQEPPKTLMSKCKLASMIEDPHQKFVYVYDTNVAWTFLIELVKIVAIDTKTTYPTCIKKFGIAPVQYIKTNVAPSIDEAAFDDEEILDDNDAYNGVASEEDATLLEGEEGELEGETTQESDEIESSGFEENSDDSFEEH